MNLDFHPTFTSSLLRKDFDLGLAAARKHEVPMPIASAVHQLVQSLVGNGFGEDDFATLLGAPGQVGWPGNWPARTRRYLTGSTPPAAIDRVIHQLGRRTGDELSPRPVP